MLTLLSYLSQPPPPPPPPQLDPSTLPAPEQVPFVPASARLSTTATAPAPTPAPVKPSPIPKKDDIVTVGQPKNKKRKTVAKSAAVEEKVAEMDVDEVEDLMPAGQGDEEEEEEEKPEKKKFDYATAPNGLDPVKGGARAEGGMKSVKVQKKRKEKKRTSRSAVCFTLNSKDIASRLTHLSCLFLFLQPTSSLETSRNRPCRWPRPSEGTRA